MFRGSTNTFEELGAFFCVTPFAFVKERDIASNSTQILLASLLSLARYVPAFIEAIPAKTLNGTGEGIKLAKLRPFGCIITR
jgi:hypothetical protein